MRQQHSFLSRRPFQDFWIALPQQTHVLDANHIEIWEPEQYSTHDIVVEIFVS
jgi:hypothetical protein